MDIVGWVAVVGGIVALLAVVVFWRQLLRAVLVLAGLGVALAVAWAFATQATATRQVATAATVSAAGNVATGALALALLAVIVIAGGYILWLRWQMRRGPQRRASGSGWVSGPNAQWGRQELPQGGTGEMVQALVQIELLRALRDLRAPQQQSGGGMPALMSDEYNDGGDSVPVSWWG